MLSSSARKAGIEKLHFILIASRFASRYARGSLEESHYAEYPRKHFPAPKNHDEDRRGGAILCGAKNEGGA